MRARTTNAKTIPPANQADSHQGACTGKLNRAAAALQAPCPFRARTSSVKTCGGRAAKFNSRSVVSCQASLPNRYRNTTPDSLAKVSAENRTCKGRRFQGTADSPDGSSGAPPSVTEVNTTCGGILGGGTGCGSKRERPRLVPIQTAPSSVARNALVLQSSQ